MTRYTVSVLETCIYHIEVEAPDGDLRTAAAEARKQFLAMNCLEQLIYLQRIEDRNFDVLSDSSSQVFDESEFADED